MSKSIISNDKKCFVCGSLNVHKHHIFHTTANRVVSEKEGCWIYLCPYHHNMSDSGIHFNNPFDVTMKIFCQHVWQETNNKTKDDFIRTFGKSYL